MVIPPQFTSAEDFNAAGLACVSVAVPEWAHVMTTEKRKFKYIRRTGDDAFKQNFSGADSFHDGVARVCIDEHHYTIDEAGTLTLIPETWGKTQGLIRFNPILLPIQPSDGLLMELEQTIRDFKPVGGKKGKLDSVARP